MEEPNQCESGPQTEYEVMPLDMRNQFQNLHALYEEIDELAETMADRLNKWNLCSVPLSLSQETI